MSIEAETVCRQTAVLFQVNILQLEFFIDPVCLKSAVQQVYLSLMLSSSVESQLTTPTVLIIGYINHRNNHYVIPDKTSVHTKVHLN